MKFIIEKTEKDKFTGENESKNNGYYIWSLPDSLFKKKDKEDEKQKMEKDRSGDQ